MENQQLALQRESLAARSYPSGGGGGGGRSSGAAARSASSPDAKISAPGKSFINSNAGKSASAWNPKAAAATNLANKLKKQAGNGGR